MHPTQHPAAQPTYEQPTYGQATSEQATSGQPTSEQPTVVQPTGGTPYSSSGWTGTTGWTDTAVLSEPSPGRPEPITRRSPDLVALIAGVLFVVVAVLGLVGTSLPGWVFGGGLVAAVLVVVGAGLLVTEVRRIRR